MARTFELDRKSRNELVEQARALGMDRPERMTRVELVDEIIRRTTPVAEQAEARGLFGVARSMLASVVESGLNLPEAASVIRGNVTASVPLGNQAPVATVTLAEIYAAQGHKARAIRMIDEVLRAEPDHQEALRVKEALTVQNEAVRAAPALDRLPSTGALVPSEPAPTPEYVPTGFVETTGEEIQTGQPPQVQGPGHSFVDEVAPATSPLPGDRSTDPAVPLDWKSQDDVLLPEALVEEAPLTAVYTETPRSAPVATFEPSSVDVPRDFDGSPAFEEVPVLEHYPENYPPPAGDPTPSELLSPGRPPALVVSHQGELVHLYWELPSAVLDQCGVDPEEGQACIRVVAFTPSGHRPSRQERTFWLHQGQKLTSDSGLMAVDSISGTAAVRAALGWAVGDSFLPICVGKTLEQLEQEGSNVAVLGRFRTHFA
jgi:hypothetical protein